MFAFEGWVIQHKRSGGVNRISGSPLWPVEDRPLPAPESETLVEQGKQRILEADKRRARDLQQTRAERTRAETAIGKLLELVETGLMSRDP